MRYSEIKKALGNVTHKMLSNKLKESEADALIIRHEYPGVPPKVEYYLSEKGKSLMPVLQSICLWDMSIFRKLYLVKVEFYSGIVVCDQS